MNRWEYLALALELWTALGLLGLLLSLFRRERRKLIQGVASLVGVWAIYLIALFIVSFRQPERRIPLGHSVCFHSLCYTIVRTEELSGYPLRNHTRLFRITLRVANHGSSAVSEDIAPILRDRDNRLWFANGSVSGNPLNVRVVPGGSVISEPIFQLDPGTTGMVLMLVHPRRTEHRLVIGDVESFNHRPQVLLLQP